jgi:hypothetical protein
MSAALVQEGRFSSTQSRARVDSQRALPGLIGASDLPRAFAGYAANGLRAEDISETNKRATVDFLANEGRLYSTIDDNY